MQKHNNELTGISCTNGLKPLVRNQYFYGKLLTVRDFENEQSYFIKKQRLINKHVHGEGVVCGLTVEKVDANTIKIKSGIALDCCGREIIVPEDVVKKISLESGTTKYWVTLRYDECGKEQVAAATEANSCAEECCFSRVEEGYKIEVLKDEPEVCSSFQADILCKSWKSLHFRKKASKNVPEEFVTQYQGVCSSVMEENSPLILATIVLKNKEIIIDNALINETDFDKKLPQRLLSNAQLADYLCLHENDKDNPHHVTAVQTGAITGINTVQNAGGNINLISEDNSIEITANDADNTVNLEVSKTILNEINAEIVLMKANLRMVLRFLMDKALKYKLKAFSSVLEHFESKTAVEIVKVVREAIDKRIYTSEKDFVSLMRYLTELETKLADEIGDAAVPERMKHYKIAIEGLKKAMMISISSREPNIFAIAVAQDEVCEMAEWLVPVIEKVKVPKITTLSIEKAKAKLAGVGLLIGNISVQVSDKPENSVLKQDPKTGTEVEKGSQVNVVIAVKPEKVKVPNVTGLYSRMAYKVLNDSNLVAGKITEEISDAEPGTVLKQIPQAGTEVDPGSAVDMTIAKASKMTVVPGIVKLSRDEAVEVLAKAKLTLGKVSEEASTKPAGRVLRQSPQPGSSVALGTAVSIVVAVAGRRRTTTTVPNLLKKTTEEVKMLLEEAHLKLGTIARVSSRAARGTVVSQNPEAGTKVPTDSKVDMSVSARIR